MVQIRKKSFPGMIYGVLIIIVGLWIQETFNLSTQQSFLLVFFGPFIVFLVGFLFYHFLIINKFDNLSHYEKMEIIETKIKQLSDPFEKKNLIIKKTKNIQLRLYDVKCLICESKIDDDEFWINFFLDNIKEIPRTNENIIDFQRFLKTLKSDNSKTKLWRILISRGIIKDDKPWSNSSFWELV